MPRIPLIVAGDSWINRHQVQSLLEQHRTQDVLIFEVNTEGPSLAALGILDVIDQHVKHHGLSPQQIWIDNWHNTVEKIPYQRAFVPSISHFFWLSERYRHTVRRGCRDPRVVACFVGRLTLERAAMVHELYHSYEQQILFSVMKRRTQLPFTSQDDLAPWVPSDQRQKFVSWWEQCPITSITNHSVRDQYDASHNTNADLVTHYDCFDLELVCETYCLGDTFFPTEKTVRPISQAKAMLIHGPRHFLRRLRELGFRTWHEFWDEDYDQLSGHDRWISIKLTLQDILAKNVIKSPGISEINQHNREVLDHLVQRFRPA